ncbi:MAG: hypothetical protein HYX80_06955 [Chloroflexi bacterium]|nr:hypothetical protein [Chloroflexota bacterium]
MIGKELQGLKPMDSIIHYYAKGGRPFQSITSLSGREANRIADELKKTGLPIFKRFEWSEYLDVRRKTESWLKSEFRKVGGKPKVDCPYYFTLGESAYLESRYDVYAATISIPLDSIANEDISFTFPDSMASRLFKQDKQYRYFNPEYHGIVFSKMGIKRIIDKFGIPQWNNAQNRDEAHDYFIEAQLWNDEYISKFLPSPLERGGGQGEGF